MPEAAKKTTPKAGATEKAKTEKAEKSATSRTNFSKLYPEDAKLTVLVEENPKRKGSKSAERFEGYKGASTVADALVAGVTYQDIAYDTGRGFIKVG